MKNVATSLNKTFLFNFNSVNIYVISSNFLWFMFSFNSKDPALIVRAGWAPDTQLAVEFIGFTWDPDSSSSSRTASQNTDTGLQKTSP